MAIPKEVLKKVRMLELSTRKLVNSVLVGEYKTVFKGQGMTFSDFREYVPGDDVRSISWALTARTGKTYIKKYEEERELSLILAVDVSGSADFGSGQKLKSQALSELACLLAWSAQKNRDQVGLLLFSDIIEHYVPPRKGRGQIHRILRDLIYFKPKSKGTDLSKALHHLLGLQKKRSIIVVLSDFQTDKYEYALAQLSRKHDVIAVQIEDPFEIQPPSLGLIDFRDLETGELATVDSSSGALQAIFQKKHEKQTAELKKKLRRCQVDLISVNTQQDISDPLIEFFQSRKKK